VLTPPLRKLSKKYATSQLKSEKNLEFFAIEGIEVQTRRRLDNKRKIMGHFSYFY
jgi:hypothetical protein